MKHVKTILKKNLKNTNCFNSLKSAIKGQLGYLDASIWQYGR